MNKIKLSSKMHLFIIISAAIIAIGLAVGLVCQFVFDGYFNYGAEFKSYNTIEVNYAYVDYSDEDDVVAICDGVFDKEGVGYYSFVSGDTNDGGRVVFKFSKGSDKEKLVKVAASVQTALQSGENGQSTATFHTVDAELNGEKVLIYASIAVASAIVLQFLYFIVRYKLTMAFAACLANIHNLALYVSLLAITRVPVGISAVAFGALTVLLTMIASGYLFDRYRRNLKKEKYAKVGGDELTDICVSESLTAILYPVLGVATAAVLLFVLLSISATSALTILTPAVAAVLCAASTLYGSTFFVPSVYTRIKSIGDSVKARSKNKKQ